MERIKFPNTPGIRMLSGVRRLWLFIKYWLPLLLWMSLIFIGSADSASVNRSSRILGPIVRWIFPNMSEEGVDTCVLIARKCAHLTEYGFCAILVWRVLRKNTRHERRPWNWREARWAWLIVFACACMDEIHQSFVPGRGASVHDVLLDMLGATLALLLLWRAGKLSKRW